MLHPLFWTWVMLGASIVLTAIGFWACMPASWRAAVIHWWNGVQHAFETDPPPLYRWVRNLAIEIAEEWGPQLARGTNRNALLLALTGTLGLYLPAEWAAYGAEHVLNVILVFYTLRVFASRKRAAGPIVTPHDRRLADAEAAANWTTLQAMERAARDEETLAAPIDYASHDNSTDATPAPDLQNAPPASAPRRTRPRPAPKKAKAKKTAKKAGKRRA